MRIRKLVYTVGYIHILTFSEYYKSIIAPYFSYQPLEYGIDNEGSIHENMRLVFRELGFILQFNKEIATLLYEGDVADVKKQNPIVDVYFDIVEKIKKINGFIKTTNNSIVVDFVEILDKDKYSEFLQSNKYIYNPFNDIDEFGTVFEFKKDNKEYKLQFGNYNEKDIGRLNLTPLKTKYNKDLTDNVGIIGQTTIVEATTLPSFSKFKTLISDAEQIFNQYLGN